MFRALSPTSFAGFWKFFFVYRCCHWESHWERTVVAIFIDHPFRISRNHAISSRLVLLERKTAVTTVTFPYNTSESAVHEFFMMRALREAERAAHMDSEVPIGAVVVRNQTDLYKRKSNKNAVEQLPQQMYEILSEQHNNVEKRFDASAHAELLAMRDAAATIQNWRLINTTLYSTLEPCPMCLSAAHAFRVQHIAYGAPDLRLGACGTFIDLVSVAQHPYHNISEVTSGIYAEESAQMLRSFFRRRRKQQEIEESASSDTIAARQRRHRPWQIWPRIWHKIAFRIAKFRNRKDM
jgi:tRNA(adenine34) deaminase